METTDITAVTRMLVEDYKMLREGKITNADARVRSQIAREILRSAHLHLQGMKLIEIQSIPVALEGES